MDHRITQCPRCGTSFRVTEAHLAVAAGAVRCGSCLHIFNARDHWVEAKPAAAPEPEKPIAKKKPVEEIEIDDDALFDDDSPLFDDEEPEPDKKTQSGSIFTPIDEDFDIIDDSGPEKFSESFLEINSWEEDTSHSFRREMDSDQDESDSEEKELDWANKLLEEDEEKTTIAAKAPARSAIFVDFDDALDNVPEIDDNDDAAEDEEIQAPPEEPNDFSDEFLNLDAEINGLASAAATTQTSLNATDPLLASAPETNADDITGESDRALFALREFEQEPIRIHQFVQESRWPKILWRCALVVALVAGVAEYFYFNFNELARGPMRPWLAQACNTLHCVLPPQIDVTQIRTNSLIVHSHPKIKGALAVDAVIVNLADFAQPFPQLMLQFSDINGAPVAGRAFNPHEYLSGELTGSHVMPPHQPIHISLELVDPGTKAVNYQLTVTAPEPSPKP